MSNLSAADKKYLESSLRLGSGDGRVLNFSTERFKDFFHDFCIDIDSPEYAGNGMSEADKFREFCRVNDNEIVGRVLIELAGHIRNSELAGNIYKHLGFSDQTERIGRKLLEMHNHQPAIRSTPTTIENNHISIEIRPEIYEHIAPFLRDGYYYNAVEEAYKIVRLKLEGITGSEKATDAFKKENIVKLFGHKPTNKKESDFFDGVKYLHMAIQFLRNEKAHTPASELDKNLAIHYLSLASLAYDLISRGRE